MPSDLRVVLDTNVIVSAVLIPQSKPRQALDHALSHGLLMVSPATAIELDEVMRRPAFEKYVPEQLRMEFLAALLQEVEVVEVTETITACRDPRDDKFLELAVDGNATHLVTGDADLLVLHPFGDTKIMTPQVFLADTERD